MSHTNTLLEVADSFGLKLSISINLGPIWFLGNSQDLNSVLDLMFFKTGSEEFNNHLISPDLQSLLDYVPLLVSIIIEEEFIQEKKWSIVRNSDKEKEFINEIICRLESTEITHITNCKQLEHIT